MIRLTHPTKKIHCEVELPASKSISNRLLIIKEYCEKVNILNLSTADDTQTLVECLKTKNSSTHFNVGHAGTSFRFLLAHFASLKGERTLTGSERMKKRPIKILVDALQSLGAHIQYSDQKGFPPVKIFGKTLEGNKIEIDGSVSSQYISALLLIAPTLKNGLQITLKNKINSRPYLLMTLNLMSEFGIKWTFEENKIHIQPGEYKSSQPNFTVERDWSAASYWFAMVALSEEGNVLLKGLTQYSLQGDSQITALAAQFGVLVEHETNGIRITKSKEVTTFSTFEENFSDIPDLAQTISVLLFGKNRNGKLSGLESLKIKESDRIFALKNELTKFGVKIEYTENALSICNSKQEWNKNITIETYSDHRMAMSFACLALIFPSININNPEVVSKSYPNFWEDLKKAGFKLDTKSE